MSTLGERILELREAKKLSRGELGSMCGLKNPSTRIGAYESGFRYPKKEMINKIAEALDVTSEFLNTGLFDKETLITLREVGIINSVQVRHKLATCFYQFYQLLDNNGVMINACLDEEDYRKMSKIIYNKVEKAKGTLDVLEPFMTESEYITYTIEMSEIEQDSAERYEEEIAMSDWQDNEDDGNY